MFQRRRYGCGSVRHISPSIYTSDAARHSHRLRRGRCRSGGTPRCSACFVCNSSQLEVAHPGHVAATNSRIRDAPQLDQLFQYHRGGRRAAYRIAVRRRHAEERLFKIQIGRQLSCFLDAYAGLLEWSISSRPDCFGAMAIRLAYRSYPYPERADGPCLSHQCDQVAAQTQFRHAQWHRLDRPNAVRALRHRRRKYAPVDLRRLWRLGLHAMVGHQSRHNVASGLGQHHRSQSTSPTSNGKLTPGKAGRIRAV